MTKAHLLALLSIALIGCDRPDKEVNGVVESVTTDGGVALPSPLCTADAQVSAKCFGPWRYQPYVAPCYKSAPSWDCPGSAHSTCQRYSLCADPSFGVAYYRDVDSTFTAHGDPDLNCVTGPTGKPKCTRTCNYDNVDFNTPATAEMKRIGGSSFGIGACTITGGTTCADKCNITVHGVPVYNTQRAYPCPLENYECGTENTCRTASNGLDAPTACGPDLPRLSSNGMTLADLQSSSSAPIYGALCTTCDDKAMTTHADVQAKYACLDGNLQAGYGTRALTIRELKLILELRANDLDETQRQKILGYYQSDATSEETSCGADWQPPAADPACTADLTGINARLVACNHLLLPHAGLDAAVALLPDCAAMGEDIDGLADNTCHKSDYQAAFRNLMIAMGKRVVETPFGQATPSQADLQLRLYALGAWYDAMAARYPAGTDRTPLYQDTSLLEATFWRNLRAAAMSRVEQADQPGAVVQVADLDATRAAALETDRQVLLAAFTVRPSTTTLPISNASLLFIVADSLQGISDRSGDLAVYHDLGCQFRASACTPQSTKVSSMFSVLGALDDASKLSAALSSATLLKSDPWGVALSTLSAQHATLEKAILDVTGAATYSPSLLSTVAGPYAPEPLVALGRVQQRARAATDSFTLRGLFDSTLRRQLGFGIQEQYVNDITGSFNTLTGALQGSLQRYQDQLTTLVSQLVAQIHNQGEQTTITDNVKRLLAQSKQLSDQEAGLRWSAGQDANRFGALSAAFQATVSAPDVDLNLQVDRQTQDFNVPTWEARFPPNTLRETLAFNTIAVQVGGATWKMSVAPGEQLHFGTTGLWAPTCAMEKYVPPDYMPSAKDIGSIDFSKINFAAATTGSEGWALSISGGVVSAHSYSNGYLNGTTDTYSDTYSGCGSVTESLSLTDGTAGATGSFANSWCSTESHAQTSSHNYTNTDSNDTDARETAALAGGVRLEKTPFPTLPAGALLLVEMKPGGNSYADIFRLHVVGHESAFVFDKPADLYLVVNDLGDPTCAAAKPQQTAPQIKVSTVRTRGLGAIIQQVYAGMSNAQAVVRGERDRLIAQVELMPTDTKHLHDLAWNELHNACGCDPAELPSVVNSLFGAFIDQEVLQIERLLKIQALQKQETLVGLELNQIKDDLSRAQNEGRLLQLVPAWTLRNLDGMLLRTDAQRLAKVMTGEIYPIVHLRYPTVINAVNADSSTYMSTLTGSDWSTSMVVIEQAAQALASNLSKDLTDTIRTTKHPEPVTIGIRFPKPGVTPIAAPWKVADASRSAAVWQGLAAGRINFSITPEDLYDPHGGGLVLTCGDAVPVIRSMAIYGVLTGAPVGTDTVLNGWNYRIPMNVGDQLFANVSAADTFELASDWRANPVHLWFGAISNATSTDMLTNKIAPSQTANGLSPFSSFDVDLASVLPPANPAGNPFQYVNELLLEFEVETATTPQPLTWVGVCRDVPLPPPAPPPPGKPSSGGSGPIYSPPPPIVVD